MTNFIGLSAPEFVSPALMPDGRIEYSFSLSHYRQDKQCVLVFYAMDFSQIDPTEMLALNTLYDLFQNRDTHIVALSTDSFLAHQMWQKLPAGKGGVGKLKFPLVADYTKVIAKGYDVILNDTFAMRATFILDNEGIVRHQSINDFPIGRNIHEMLRIIDAMDFHRKEGLLCPANWQPGEAAIKPQDEFAREFISTQLAAL